MLAERLRESLDGLANVEVIGAVDDEAAAIDLVRRETVDVIILDLQLKEGTGFGVMRSLGDLRPIVIVFTNYVLPEYQRLASALGVEYFLDKSVDYDRLPQLLQEIGSTRPH